MDVNILCHQRENKNGYHKAQHLSDDTHFKIEDTEANIRHALEGNLIRKDEFPSDTEEIWTLLYCGWKRECDPFSISAPLWWTTLQDDVYP